MWNCDRGNILSRNIWLKLVAPENSVSGLGILLGSLRNEDDDGYEDFI